MVRGKALPLGPLLLTILLLVPATQAGAIPTTDGEPTSDDGEAPTTPAPRIAYIGTPSSPPAAAGGGARGGGAAGGAAPAARERRGPWLPSGPIPVPGGDSPDHCAGAPVTTDRYTLMLNELHVAAQDLLDTSSIVAEILAVQPCLDGAVSHTDLAYPSFMAGVVAGQDSDRTGCQAAFAQVFAVDLAYPWDHNYHPLIHDCFSDAKVHLVEQPKVSVSIRRIEGTQVWLDGTPWDAADDTMDVFPGRHLVQIAGPGDEGTRGVAFTVADGTPVTLVDPAILDAPLGDDRDLLAGVLADLDRAAPGSVPDVLIESGGDALAVWRWDRESGSLLPWQAENDSPGRGPRVARKGNPAVPVLIGAGAALLVGGAVMTGVSQGELDDLRGEVEAGRLPMAEPDDPDASAAQRATRDEWDRHDSTRATGIGLMAGGGLALVAAIPVGIVGAKKQRELSLSAGAVLPLSPEAADREFAVGLTFHIR